MELDRARKMQRLVGMNESVRKARVAYLMATISLETAIRKGEVDKVIMLAAHKTDTVNTLINTIREVDPTYFEIPPHARSLERKA